MENTVFYCQLDYAHIPYPSPTSPNGTVADNGCGVCAASMLVENMLRIPFPPEESAALAKACDSGLVELFEGDWLDELAEKIM